MEGIWNNIKQKLPGLKKDKNAALRKCMGILLAGICLLVILWPSDKKNGFSGLDALTGTKQDKTSGGVTGKQQNGEYASDNGQGISGEESSANSGYEDYIAFQEEKTARDTVSGERRRNGKCHDHIKRWRREDHREGCDEVR